MSLTLFISRQIKDDSPLLELDLDIIAESFISIDILNDLPDLESVDWIFFSSVNGLKWAIENKLDLEKFKIASVGSSTGKELTNHGIQVNFVGDDGKDVSEISEDFNKAVGENEKALFPISSKSKKTILQNFSKDYLEVIAYKTESDPIILDLEIDIYVFTSPSNFRSFFEANSVDESKLILAIGNTTKSEIEKFVNIPIFTPEEKTERSIYEKLKTLIPAHFPNQSV